MSNSLSKEHSPYLRQHMDNPVDWLPWGPEAFYKAEREDKPIFLSIGYSTCHWCHVMAHESFENEQVAALLNTGVIDLAQLHGDEDEAYIQTLRGMTDKPIIQAFRIDSEADIAAARASSADLVLLDSGAGGTGTTFDWTLLRDIGRDWFLAGGLGADNAAQAVSRFHPYGVDVSSGIETDGLKDENKMTAFVRAVRSVPEGDRP